MAQVVKGTKDSVCWLHKVLVTIAKSGKPTMCSYSGIQIMDLLVPSHRKPGTLLTCSLPSLSP